MEYNTSKKINKNLILWFLAFCIFVFINTKYFWEVNPLISFIGTVIFFSLIIVTITITLIFIYAIIFRNYILKQLISYLLIYYSGIQLLLFGFDIVNWKNYLESPKIILSAEWVIRDNWSLLFFKDGTFIDRSYSHYRIDNHGQFTFINDTIRMEYLEKGNLYPIIEFAIFLPDGDGCSFLSCFYKRPWQIETYSQFQFKILNIDSSYFNCLE